MPRVVTPHQEVSPDTGDITTQLRLILASNFSPDSDCSRELSVGQQPQQTAQNYTAPFPRPNTTAHLTSGDLQSLSVRNAHPKLPTAHHPPLPVSPPSPRPTLGRSLRPHNTPPTPCTHRHARTRGRAVACVPCVGLAPPLATRVGMGTGTGHLAGVSRKGPELARSSNRRAASRRARPSRCRSRETTLHTRRANPPAPRARHAADPRTPQACHAPCAAVSKRERPAPVRAAGPRVAGARAPPRINALLAQPHAASAHRFATAQPAMQSPARSMPLPGKRCAWLGVAPAPPILRPSLRTTNNRRGRRPPCAAACARPCCTLLHTHDCRNVRKVPWSACKAARSGGARTAFPGQVSPRGPDSPTLTPRQTRHVGHAARAADRHL